MNTVILICEEGVGKSSLMIELSKKYDKVIDVGSLKATNSDRGININGKNYEICTNPDTIDKVDLIAVGGSKIQATFQERFHFSPTLLLKLYEPSQEVEEVIEKVDPIEELRREERQRKLKEKNIKKARKQEWKYRK